MSFNPLDGTVIGILVFFMIYGIFKGFIKPVISLVSWGVALTLIYLFSGQLGDVLMSTSMGGWISPMLEGTTESLGDYMSSVIVEVNGEWVFLAGGATIQSVLEQSLLIPNFMITSIMSNLQAGALSLSVNAALLSSVGQVAATLMIALSTGIVFFLFKVLVCRSIKGKRVGAVNRTFGALLYLAMGVFFIFFSFVIIEFVVGFFNTPIAEQIKKMLNEGFLTKYITQYNPITMLINLI